jgi:hypothetical protein
VVGSCDHLSDDVAVSISKAAYFVQFGALT